MSEKTDTSCRKKPTAGVTKIILDKHFGAGYNITVFPARGSGLEIFCYKAGQPACAGCFVLGKKIHNMCNILPIKIQYIVLTWVVSYGIIILQRWARRPA